MLTSNAPAFSDSPSLADNIITRLGTFLIRLRPQHVSERKNADPSIPLTAGCFKRVDGLPGSMTFQVRSGLGLSTTDLTTEHLLWFGIRRTRLNSFAGRDKQQRFISDIQLLLNR
jgi:hypothetical protein